MLNRKSRKVRMWMPMVAALVVMAATAPAVLAEHDEPSVFDRLRVGVRVGDGGFGIRIEKGHVHRPVEHVHSRHCVHTPGRYEVRTERVLVREAWTERIWVEPVYETRCDRFGRHYTLVVREGYYRTICHPAEYRTREYRVWIPERYECHEHVTTTARHDHDHYDRDDHRYGRGGGYGWGRGGRWKH